tara:strand:+ start:488 stop:703 length:216 start_codon:yes stop_codon:yes gene_type:complete
MKNQKSVFEFGNEYVCQSFTDVDPDVSGVEVYENDERLGQIVGLSIPDIEYEDANIRFDNEVVDWIVDNGH